MTERVRTGLYLLDSDNVNSLTSPPPQFECLLATSAACWSSEMDEKLIHFFLSLRSAFFLRLTSMLLLLNVFQKTNGAAYLMEIIAGLLSHAVLEGD